MAPKWSFQILLATVTLSSCSSEKTVFITNKTGKALFVTVAKNDRPESATNFCRSLDSLEIGKKRKIPFGTGKWSREERNDLEQMLNHAHFHDLKGKELSPHFSIRYIRLGVEELWVVLQ